MNDRYKIIKLIEELPFGDRYEAKDLLIDRKTEIHRFKTPRKKASKNWKKLYKTGSAALTSITHIGLPIIFDRGIKSNEPFLIRQYIESPSLLSRLEEGPLSEYEIWELAQQILDIHIAGLEKNFFHGSLSPERICYSARLSGEKRYYITDFGLGELHNIINDTNDYFGWPCLICRRQVQGNPPSEVSEIFSIGQLLYLCLADNHPFAENKICEMEALHKNFPLAPVHEIRPDIPQAMSDWMSRLTAVIPEERYQTYEEARNALPAPIQTVAAPLVAVTASQYQTQVVTPEAIPSTTSYQPMMPSQADTGTASIFPLPPAPTTTPVKEKSILKILQTKPLILAGIIVAILTGIALYLFSNSRDSKISQTDTTQKLKGNKPIKTLVKSASSAQLKKEAVIALSFSNTISAENGISLEPLKSAPTFSKGVNGKGLILDSNHYYRLPIKQILNQKHTSQFTVFFSVKNTSPWKPAFISNQSWERWSHGSQQKIKSLKNTTLWQWTPSEKQSDNWTQIAIVFSIKKETVSLYKNGKKIGRASSSIIQSLKDEPYIFLGCDSQQHSTFSSPVVIDQFYIWNRALNDVEIKNIHEDSSF